jgi:hypothetical protein
MHALLLILAWTLYVGVPSLQGFNSGPWAHHRRGSDPIGGTQSTGFQQWPLGPPCLLCHSQSRATDIFHPPHATGVLRAPASASVATLLRFGGDLHPLMRDVCRRATIIPPLSDVPHVALDREGDEPDQHLLLLAPSLGTSCLHCGS